jgi:hypothetical protein
MMTVTRLASADALAGPVALSLLCASRAESSSSGSAIDPTLKLRSELAGPGPPDSEPERQRRLRSCHWQCRGGTVRDLFVSACDPSPDPRKGPGQGRNRRLQPWPVRTKLNLNFKLTGKGGTWRTTSMTVPNSLTSYRDSDCQPECACQWRETALNKLQAW